ncbi:hypothetical protein BKA80DRAFT_100351 [Phyllosticta citrichinensis]
MRGIALVLAYEVEESAPIFENWKEHEMHDLPTRLLWRCAEHMPRGGKNPDRGQDYLSWFLKRDHIVPPKVEVCQPFRNKGKGPEELIFDPRRMVRACGGHFAEGGICDGSIMMFEIPDVGFRFVLQVDKGSLYGWDDGQLFVHFGLPSTGQGEEGDGKDTAAQLHQQHCNPKALSPSKQK